MERAMTYLVVSQFLMWVVVCALAFVCVALARQVGVLHTRLAPAGALAINSRLSPGEAAPQLDVESLSGEVMQVGGARDRSQLLFFLAPSCPVCKSLLPVLRSAARGESSWVDVVLASDGELAAHREFVASHELTSFPYIVSELLGRTFGVSKLPYAVLIDEAGRIAALGLINSREHLESLFEAKERGTATLQQHLSLRQHPARP
jgi:methylamine dehydrogenase accessory protein MauD